MGINDDYDGFCDWDVVVVVVVVDNDHEEEGGWWWRLHGDGDGIDVDEEDDGDDDDDQRANKVVSDSPGLVEFAIGLVNSVINLPDG